MVQAGLPDNVGGADQNYSVGQGSQSVMPVSVCQHFPLWLPTDSRTVRDERERERPASGCIVAMTGEVFSGVISREGLLGNCTAAAYSGWYETNEDLSTERAVSNNSWG
jgi:hypothetical protein